MSDSDQDRQHPATPQRLKRAREEGDVAHSHELAIAVQMVVGVATLWFCAGTIGNGLIQTTTSLWRQSTISADPNEIVNKSSSLLLLTVQLVLPFLICIFVVGSLAHLAQTQFLVSRPKLRVRAILGRQWMDNLFSFSTVGQFVMASPKILLSLGVAAAVIWVDQDSFFALGSTPVLLLPEALLSLTFNVSISVAATLLACSVFDYAANWVSLQQRLKMTDQEVREELRGQSGDPQIARIRHQRMREITRERR